VTTNLYLFHDLLYRSYLYDCDCSVITAHKLTSAKHDESILGDVHWTVAVVTWAYSIATHARCRGSLN